MKTKILVLCTGNSCRSQMAEGFLKHYGQDKVIVHSAGVESHGLNPKAVQVMQEVGIDISQHTSDIMDKYFANQYDIVFTVCDNAKESCPIFPYTTRTIHHSFPDPAKATGSPTEVLAQFRNTRDLIADFCKELLTKLTIPV